MRKLKNGIIELLVCIIIFASFKMPEKLLKMENDKIQLAIYEKEKDETTIDVEAEEIYLVKAIHDMESEESSVEITSSSEIVEKIIFVEEPKDTTSIYKELQRLKEYNILKELEIKNHEIELINKFYQRENRRYGIETFLLIGENEATFKVEQKTGKILELAIRKDKIINTSKEEIMKNYVQYLDLYIIDDWKFENNMLKSEKAQLIVNLITSQKSEFNYAILTIHSTDNLFQIVQ